MVAFQYQAIKLSDRSRISGLVQADSEKEAREQLRRDNLIPTRLEMIKNQYGDSQADSPLDKLMDSFTSVGAKERITFTRNLALMTKSGLPITDSLLYFENYSSNRKFKRVLAQIRRDILSGISLSQALSKHKQLFDEVYVNVTRAGETSGELETTLGRLTEILTKSEKLKGKIVSASVYPGIVLGIVCLVLLVMFLFIIPTFTKIYSQMGVQLPLITQVAVWISNVLSQQWYFAFPTLGISAFVGYKMLRSNIVKPVIDRILLKVPILGELVNLTNNSSFLSSFQITFGAGVPITEALDLASRTVNNTVLRKAFQQVNIDIQSGQRLGASLTKTRQVPELVVLMVSAGEESGELEKMLQTAFEYLEEEVNQKVEILMTFMEPLLLLTLGIVVGLIALAVYLPLFSMYENM